MALRVPRKGTDDAELDVTAFMNLMIVLVPVLLLSMNFTRVTILELKLPELTGGSAVSDTSQSKLEVVMDQAGFKVYFPEDKLIQTIPAVVDDANNKIYNFKVLSEVMQLVKMQDQDKKDVVILLDKDIGYQDIVQTMDTVKSYRTVHIASVVDVELFPQVSLGDMR